MACYSKQTPDNNYGNVQIVNGCWYAIQLIGLLRSLTTQQYV